MKTMLSVALTGICALLALTPARAEQCDADFKSPVTVNLIGGGYDSFAPGLRTQDFELQLRNTSSTECRLLLAFEMENGRAILDHQGQELVFDLYAKGSSRGLIEDGSEAIPPTRATPITLSPNEERDLRFSLVIPEGQIVADGDYRARILSRLFDEAGTTLLAETDLSISVDVLQRASVTLAGASVSGNGLSRHYLDFGILRSGMTNDANPVFVQVLSNVPHLLTFTSEYGGELRREGSGERWAIPYAMSVGGVPVPLSGQVASPVSMNRDATSLAGDRMPLVLKLGTVEDKRAGVYRDTVTINIIPQS